MQRPVPQRWIQPPRQRRSQQTLERLLDAAEALIEEKGFEDTTLADVARRAGSSVSAFYRRFRDKDALLHALHERHQEQCRATVEHNLAPEQWEEASITEILVDFSVFAVEVARWKQGFRRAVFRRSLSDPVFAERELQLQRLIGKGMTQLLMARRSEIRHPDPTIAVDFVWRQIIAVLTRRFDAAPLDLEIVPLSDERLVREATRAALAYLGISTDGLRESVHRRMIDLNMRESLGVPE